MEPEWLQRMAEAFKGVSQAFNTLARGMRKACLEMDYQRRLRMARTPKERRRLVRDWQRLHRRPALIHNGKKAKR